MRPGTLTPFGTLGDVHSSHSGRWHRGVWGLLATALLVAVLAAPAARADAPDRTWLTAWSTGHVRQDGSSEFTMAAFPLQTVDDQTLRQIVQPQADGDQIRIRLSNVEGGGTVTFGHVTVAKAVESGPALERGTSRDVFFGDDRFITLEPGREAQSDPVEIDVEAGEHLAISTYIVSASGPYSGHSEAKNLGWYTAPGVGDRTMDAEAELMPFPTPSTSWLRTVDVRTEPRPVVVVLGDSISDGYLTPEVRTEWPGVLAERLSGQAIVLNNAIDANVVTHTGCPQCGPAIVDRFGRDALDISGVTDIIVLAGSNDITQSVPVDDITAGYAHLAARAHAHGIDLILGTLTPRDDFALGWDPAVHGPRRHEINRWILDEAPADAVVDFDRILRDPIRPDSMKPYYDSGDRLHPNPLGMATMADAVPAGLFSSAPSRDRQPHA